MDERCTGTNTGRAIRSLDGGLAINPLIAKAIAMGDEFHQRNIAASLCFYKEMAPIITDMDMPQDEKSSVMKFLADTDQFFLNIMMATGKAIMDGARTLTDGTVVTAMCRNGVNFGIRIAGMGDEWFNRSGNTPQVCTSPVMTARMLARISATVQLPKPLVSVEWQ